MITSSAVKAKARELGFELCGIAPVEDFPELAFLREWLDRGNGADMDWMRRTLDRRTDVRNALPGVRSVVMTGTLYNTDRSYSSELPADVARVSRYAWGDDYHGVIERRLDALLEWIRASLDPDERAAFRAHAYVDTGPVQERVYAQYAGLGWIGKNTCLINPEIGSWLFLAEILCTLPLEPDAQGLEQCGSCRRCLDACPTGALVEPGVLDARRCISYLTIEHRGELAPEDAAAIGAHVYGCDICQEVCPFNNPAPASQDPAWQPRHGLDLPRLVDLASCSDDELRRMIKGSAMTRAHVSGVRRNIDAALVNVTGNTAPHRTPTTRPLQ